MNDCFLKNVAAYLYRAHKDDLGESVVVFPGKRAAVFFKKHLAEEVQSAMWSPALITVNEMFRELSGLIVIDNLKLLFTLYEVYCEETKSNESFDQFYFWGEMLLNDFDDIDKYLADASQLFKNIESVKSIDEHFGTLQEKDIEIIKQFWTNFNPDSKSIHKDEFIKIWKVLYNVYSKFNTNLTNQSFAYEGMAFRNVADKIIKGEELVFPWHKVFFVGLNALNPCETTVMKYLKTRGMAEFFWDYDELYTNSKVHEAGYFMRENIRTFPPPGFNNSINNIASVKKQIDLISVASSVGQAKYLPSILDKKYNNKENPDIETCIVLADENLLVPVLHSVPKEIERVNITMGFPVTGSNIYHFILLLKELQQTSKKSDGVVLFYNKPVVSILNHQYLSGFSDITTELKCKITEQNLIYVENNEFEKSGFLKSFFVKTDNVKSFSDYLLDIIYRIFLDLSGPRTENTNVEIEKEFIYEAYVIIKRLNVIIEETGISPELSTYYRMLIKAMQSGKVNFIGEPLAGLQIMGTLETRSIDFKNLIILSMNEGVFPRKSVAVSFIPYNLRKAFKLPTYEHQDAIYAYYFYRLIQRAENITLVYNASAEGMNSGEMSRYIYQLLYLTDLQIKIKNIEFNIQGNERIPINIIKTPEINKTLEKYIYGKGNSYLSPSAINCFKNCSLRFYFRYIESVKESEEVSEEVDAALFGNIFHASVNILYSDLIDTIITSEALSEKLDDSKINKAIDKAFIQELYKWQDENNLNFSGKDLIIKEIIKKYIKKVIEIDIETAPFKIVSLEKHYEMSFDIFNGTQKIKIGGTIDRVDLKDNNLRVIDYKTGAKHNIFNNLEEIFSGDSPEKYDAILQTFIYSLILNHQPGIDKNIIPCLLYLREIFKSADINIKKVTGPRKHGPVNSFTEYKSDLIIRLQQLLEKLFNKEGAFTQTNNEDYCKNCSYKEICHRG